jgi:hypothetical protein
VGRIVGELNQEGIIRSDGKRVVILDLEKLQANLANSGQP